MARKTYYVRDGAPGALGTAAAATAAYVAAGRDDPRFPYWTWQKPEPLPLEQAQALLEAGLRMGCRGLLLQSAELLKLAPGVGVPVGSPLRSGAPEAEP